MGKKLHYYKAFGLVIQSPLNCASLRPADSHDADVVVSFGSFPTEIADSSETTIVNIKDIARYLVEKGSKITIDPYPGAQEHEIQLFLLGSVMGALLHQRQLLVLHGSAIVTEHGVVAFVAPSGFGKSTMAATYHHKGFPVLSDDLCVIDVTRGLAVLPSYSQIKLWQEALSHFDIHDHDFERIHNKFEKYIMPLNKTDHSPLHRLTAIFELNKADHTDIVPVHGLGKATILINHTYRYYLLRKMGLLKEHMQLCQQVAAQVKLYKINRQQDLTALPALSDRVLQQLVEH